MKKQTDYYLVKADILPEVMLKVAEVKRILEQTKGLSVQDAVKKVDISRTAYYKYRDSITPFYENTRGKTVTISIDLTDTPGFLANILKVIADANVNILTINQSIPLNNWTNIIITMEVDQEAVSIQPLFEGIKNHRGVTNFKIMSRE